MGDANRRVGTPPHFWAILPYLETGEIRTCRIDEAGGEWDELMRVVWHNGELLVRDSLAVIRERAGWSC